LDLILLSFFFVDAKMCFFGVNASVYVRNSGIFETVQISRSY